MLIDGVPAEIFRHQVSRVVSPEDLVELNTFSVLDLLDPEGVDVDMPHLAGTFSFGNAQCCRGVGIHRP